MRNRLAVSLVIILLSGCAETIPPAPPTGAPDPQAVARGAYLFTAANCEGCHTDKEHKGARLAGGRAVMTPFGAYYSRNISPDPAHGIGAWSDAAFLRALRSGLSPQGGHYFAAFPFAAFTQMSDRDILDIKAYLATQPPQAAENKPHDVPFPFDVRLSMVLWRTLYFTPGPRLPDPAHDATWNRGAYLVHAVAHCPECHTPRSMLGGLDGDRLFGGGTLVGPGVNHAPNISSDQKDGIGAWSVDDVVALLKLGQIKGGDFVGAPMSEVVDRTGKLTDADRLAIATYIKSLPPIPGKGG